MSRNTRLLLATALVAFADAPRVASAASETVHVVTVQPTGPQADAGITFTLMPVAMAEDATLGREIPGLPHDGGDSPASVSGDTAHFQDTWSGSRFETGYKKRGVGRVLVQDQLGVPVPNTRVYYRWSGCTTESSSAVTNALGVAEFLTQKTSSCGRGGSFNCYWVLTGISLTPPPPVVYNVSQDVDTTHSAICTVQ